MRYDPNKNDYSILSNLPLEAWYSFDVVSYDAYVFIYGGSSNGRWSNRGFVYDTAYDRWESMPSMKRARRRCACAILIIPDTNLRRADGEGAPDLDDAL